MACAGTYSGGSGTAEDPYKISTVADWQELIATSAEWDKNYILLNDIDFGGANLAPIGNGLKPFTGVIEGNRHVLRDVKISLPTTFDVGLIGFLKGGEIRNLGAEGISVTGQYNVGGLVGVSSGTITACYATGTVSCTGTGPVGGLVGHNSGLIQACCASSVVEGNGFVGGLVGGNQGTISASYASGPVTCPDNYVGGLVGYCHEGYQCIIHNCYSTGFVTGKDGYAGGLVGGMYGSTITSSFWDIETSGPNGSGPGRGLTTKQMKSLIIFQNADWADTSWIMNDGEDYPRLAWEGIPGLPIPIAEPIPLSGSGTVEDPYRIGTAEEFALLSWYAAAFDRCFILTADLDLSGFHLYPIGEFRSYIGKFDGMGHVLQNVAIDLPKSHNVGVFSQLESGGEIRNLGLENATVIGRSFVGGIVGNNFGIIHNCFTSGKVSGSGENIGGVVGRTHGTLYNCYATGSVSRRNGVTSGNSYVGGICGTNGDNMEPVGTVRNCWVTSDVNDITGRCTGGLIGVNYGAMSCCSATGTVWGGDLVGGLVGSNCTATMERCFASGSVSGFWAVGGLTGVNEKATIRSSYSTGSPIGQSFIGGLVGYSEFGTVINSYSTGKPTGTKHVGGLCGYVSTWSLPSIDKNNFWDAQTSEMATSEMGTGKTTGEMKTLATFMGAGWDFVGEQTSGTEDVWRMCADGVDYPRLSWEFSGNGDFDCPDGVELEDMLYLVERWMMGTPEIIGAADANGDGRVGIEDFAVLAENWVQK